MARRRKTEGLRPLLHGLHLLRLRGDHPLLRDPATAAERGRTSDARPLRAETDRLEQQVLEGQANLVELRNTFDAGPAADARPPGLSTRLIDVVKQSQEELATYEREDDRAARARQQAAGRPPLAGRGSEAALRRDQEPRGPGRQGPLVRRGRGPPVPDRPQGRRQAHPVPGRRLRQHARGHDRQRGAAPPPPRRGPRARRQVAPGGEGGRLADHADPAGRAVPDLRLQHAGPRPSCPARDGTWLAGARTATSLGQAVANLRGTAPEGGTSLEQAFAAAAAMRPAARQHHRPHRRPAHAGTRPRPAARPSPAATASSSSTARSTRCRAACP